MDAHMQDSTFGDESYAHGLSIHTDPSKRIGRPFPNAFQLAAVGYNKTPPHISIVLLTKTLLILCIICIY